jgi:hypothetical protein
MFVLLSAYKMLSASYYSSWCVTVCLKYWLISSWVCLLATVTAITGWPLWGLSPIFVLPLLKCPTQHLSVLTSMVCSSYTLFRHLWISMGLNSGSKEFNHLCLLHTCNYDICHFEFLLHCAQVTDPSTTHYWETRDFSCSISDMHSFL